MKKEELKQKAKKLLKTTLLFITNPRLLLCFGIAWLITNGWSYILLGIGTWFEIEWMQLVAGAWLAFLWVPGTPEKIVTIALSLVFLRWLFPNDQKTLKILRDLRLKTKKKIKEKKKKQDEEHPSQ